MADRISAERMEELAIWYDDVVTSRRLTIRTPTGAEVAAALRQAAATERERERLEARLAAAESLCANLRPMLDEMRPVWGNSNVHTLEHFIAAVRPRGG